MKALDQILEWEEPWKSLNIRSITCPKIPTFPLEKEALGKAASFLEAARPAFRSAGFPVRPRGKRYLSPARAQLGPSSRFIDRPGD